MPEFADFADSLKDSFDETLWELMFNASLPSLGDGPRDEPLIACLNAGLGKSLTVQDAAKDNCLSGLWLLAGDIDRSHTISQDLPSREGSFLHGIMHRREGDFGNAKYWFRKVGEHPVLDQVNHHTDGVYSDPYDFVDACSQASRDRDALIQAQWIEWQALMLYIVATP